MMMVWSPFMMMEVMTVASTPQCGQHYGASIPCISLYYNPEVILSVAEFDYQMMTSGHSNLFLKDKIM